LGSFPKITGPLTRSSFARKKIMKKWGVARPFLVNGRIFGNRKKKNFEKKRFQKNGGAKFGRGVSTKKPGGKKFWKKDRRALGKRIKTKRKKLTEPKGKFGKKFKKTPAP